ncbi:hypothetical protein [Streptomyces sp. NPDC049906]|uniref:hypothetical protein n=1 Tax=Streptomyces sp. NPDC049906 TaxID=3155656 RepID=UPI003419862D
MTTPIPPPDAPATPLAPPSFLPHLRRATAAALSRLPRALGPEVYVLSFRIGRIADDPRRPRLTVGGNTEGRFRAQRVRHGTDEARWNPLHWLPGGEVVGDGPVAAAFRAEAVRLGHWYEDGDDLTDAEEDDCAEALYALFADACERVADALTTDGTLLRALGRTVPVVVHDPVLAGWEPPRPPDPRLPPSAPHP